MSKFARIGFLNSFVTKTIIQYMKKRIKYAAIIILAAFITVNIADFIMFQRFKSICKQEMSILNSEDSFSDENNKKLNELISEKEMIISISNNHFWDFISIIPK